VLDATQTNARPPDAEGGRTPAPALQVVGRLRVIYGDTDQMGFVYYANYLRYFEVARNELLRGIGISYRSFESEHALLIPVAESFVKYRRPARFDDELVLKAALSISGRASARFDYEIQRAEDSVRIVDGHTLHVCVDKSGKVQKIPDDVRAFLARAGIPG
jgi:acyl-CoA thioester hydrolase